MPLKLDKSDFDLLQQLKNDDEHAFTLIYNRYWKQIFSLAYYKLKSLEDAEEIVQDIFYSLWTRRKAIEITGELKNYLAVSTKYRIIKAIAKSSRQQDYLDSVLQNVYIDNSTQELLDFQELKLELVKYVDELPDKCRLVFQLSRDQGLTQRQIAQELGISEKTVEAHIGKAIKVLKGKLSTFLNFLL